MDISEWPIEHKLMLPEWCYGQKFPVSVAWQAAAWGTDVKDISEDSYPAECLLWEIIICTQRVTTTDCYIRLALGFQLPENEAGMMELEPLIRGFGVTGPEPRKITTQNNNYIERFRLRRYLVTGGRRLIVYVRIPTTANVGIGHVITIVSSIPKKVPDWLLSSQVKSL